MSVPARPGAPSRSVRRAAALLLSVVLFCGGAPAAAQPADPAERQAVNAQFLTGLQALEAGQPEAAIRTFRSILGRYPSLVRVRLELGRAYFDNRQWLEARREFERVLAADIPPTVQRNVLVFIRRIDSRRGFDWRFDVGITRLGDARNYETDAIELDFGGVVLPSVIARPDESELGIVYDASARFALPVEADALAGAGPTLVISPFVFGEHAEAEVLRDRTAGLRLGLQVATLRSTTRADLIGQRRDLAGDPYEIREGAELVHERRSSDGRTVFGRVRHLVIDNRLSDALDGSETRVTLGASAGLGARARLGAAVFAERRDADLAFEEYDRQGVTVFAGVEPGLGLDVAASAFVATRDFVEPNPLFVDNPDDREIGATLRVEKVDRFIFARFTPYAMVEARRVESGIDAFSYTETGLTFGLEKAF